MVSEIKIRNIINHYKSYRESDPDTWLEFSATQSNLKDAIKVSSLCINQCNKRHPHQYRIKSKSLKELCDKLLKQITFIEESKDFDELFSIIDRTTVYGIGDLTKYDVAQRIGKYLKLFPTKIYVHSGTKIGAQYLIGKIKSRTITKEQLPAIFNDGNLSCSEIEDILCIYKERFKSRI